MPNPVDHSLDFLLSFDGRVHMFEEGYWVKFEIRRSEDGDERPHGLRYSFTLHDPDNSRILGFDNAHSVPAHGSRFKRAPVAYDHWHRTGDDAGRPYEFIDADTLLEDFLKEVTRVLAERGIALDVIEVKEAKEGRDEGSEL